MPSMPKLASLRLRGQDLPVRNLSCILFRHLVYHDLPNRAVAGRRKTLSTRTREERRCALQSLLWMRCYVRCHDDVSRGEPRSLAERSVIRVMMTRRREKKVK